jgi:hypothetical protein
MSYTFSQQTLRRNRFQTFDGRYIYEELHAMAARIAAMRRERARQLCKEAGLDPGLLGIHPHNAMVSLSYGKPWREVDYSKCRACIRVIDQMHDGHEIVRKLYKRLDNRRFCADGNNVN